MSKDPWIKWFPGDFLGGVSELEPGEGWVYTIVLNLIYDGAGPWPLNIERLARRCRMRPSSVQKALDTLIDLGKLTLADGRLSNPRAEKSLKTRQKVSEKSAESARTRWEKERGNVNENNATDDASAMRTVCERDANQKLEARSQSISEANASSVASALPDATGGLFAIDHDAEPDKPRAKPDPWAGDQDFAALWQGATDQMRRRSVAKAKLWPVWREARAKAGGGAMLVAAMRRYRAGDPDVGRTGGPALERWLRDGVWEHWLGQEEPAASVAAWRGPRQVREAVVAQAGEEFARGFLDGAAWRPAPERAVIARNSFIAGRLDREVGMVFRQMGVAIVVGEGVLA